MEETSKTRTDQKLRFFSGEIKHKTKMAKIK